MSNQQENQTLNLSHPTYYCTRDRRRLTAKKTADQLENKLEDLPSRAMASAIKTTPQLYKHLLRECKMLPNEVQDYYKHYWRQQLNSHLDETDPQRIQGIIEQAIKDMQWIRNKVG